MAQNEPRAEQKNRGRSDRGLGPPSREELPQRQDDPERGARHEGESREHNGPNAQPPDHKPPAYKRPGVIIPIAAVLLIGLVSAFLYWLHARHYESTDDAYIDGNVVQISPQISAQVLALHIDDNQFVRRGDLLLELDPSEYEVALQQARAQTASSTGKLEQTRTQVGAAQAAVSQAQAEVDAAQVAWGNASRELDRYQALDERARSRQQLDNLVAAQRTDRRNSSKPGPRNTPPKPMSQPPARRSKRPKGICARPKRRYTGPN